jgi:hypothetical protein
VRKCARFDIWAYGRPNPFNPLPGFGFRLTHDVRMRIAKAFREYVDRRARRAGREAFRHAIPFEQFLA